MNCYYCNGSLSHDGWDFCPDCDVKFHINDYNSELHIKWERRINNHWWALNIYPESNITYLSGTKEFKINQTIKVNKNNIINKIKTILIFQ